LNNRASIGLFANKYMCVPIDIGKEMKQENTPERKRKLIIEYGLMSLFCIPVAGMWFHRKII
jgi:hypothetical protein